MPLDYHKIKNWPFPRETRTYSREDVVRYARGFGAGLPGPLQRDDERFIGNGDVHVLPMTAVALADGTFWQKEPAASLQWQQIVHAEEALTLHRPLLTAGTLNIDRRVMEIYDRGRERGAMLHEQQTLSDAEGAAVATIDVLTVLRGDGGFGGTSTGAPQVRPVPQDRAPDEVMELAAPSGDNPVFGLSGDFDVTQSLPGVRPGQIMLRGLCAFGLAGRAALRLLCDNDPARLRRLSVRYAGPLLSDETVRIDLWRTRPGNAAFLMHAVERDARILQHCHVEYKP